MKEYNVFKLAYFSLRKAGLKVTLGKATNFLKRYLFKTPFEKVIMLKYRYYVSPEELQNPVSENSAPQSELDFSGRPFDLNVIVNFDSMADARLSHADSSPLTANDLALAAQLASKHGIYGFCFHINTATESSQLDLLRSHPEIGIRYCFSYADIKAMQCKEKPASCLKKLSVYFQDPRYITVNGGPLILLRDPDESFTPSIWKEQARTLGIANLQVWVYCESEKHIRTKRNTAGADAIVECFPAGLNEQTGVLPKRVLKAGGGDRYHYAKVGIYRTALTHFQIMNNQQEKTPSCPLYRTCFMGLDPAIHSKTGSPSIVGVSSRLRETKGAVSESEQLP